MATRLETLFWVTVDVFGFRVLAAGLVSVSGGATGPGTVGALLGGALVAAAATRGFLAGDAVTAGANDASPLVRLLAVGGALGYLVGIVLQFL
jgi:hypothetical protein